MTCASCPTRQGGPGQAPRALVPMPAFKDALSDNRPVLGEGWRWKHLQQRGGGWGGGWGGVGVNRGKSQAGSTRRGWGAAVGVESRNLGCLMVTWGGVLEVRNIQPCMNQRWALEHAPSATKAKTKGQVRLPGQKGQPRNAS